MKHKVNHLHFIGIGGTGMSGIAEVLLNLGFRVTGSDQQKSAVTERLTAIGAVVLFGHRAENIADADVIVISSAVKDDNPEVVAARQRKIPIVPRAQMLAELMRLRQGIAIAGTHGKTTTTSLVASIMAEGGLDPTFVIGGRLNAVAANAKLGQGDFIVVEADESDASFLCLTPVLSVITNIDSDHMETYGHDIERLYQAFIDFTNRLPFYGSVVMCADDLGNQKIIPRISKPLISYGLGEEAQIRGRDIECDHGRMKFIASSDDFTIPVELAIPGQHNVLNALAAIAIAYELQIEPAAIIKALSEFKGVGRRFQRYGEHRNVSGGIFTIVDDYGHHPVELAATIAAARGAFPGRRLVLAFQPHRYSRTRDCFEDFVKVLGQVDLLLLCEVYAAGEMPIIAADSKSLARAIRVHGKLEPYYIENITDLPITVSDLVIDGDVLLCMGAGSIGQSAAQIVSYLHARNND